MATIFSLVVWGGSTGKQMSGSTSTHLFTLTNHGLRTGTGIVCQTTGGNFTANTTYYVNATRSGTTVNAVYLYNTYADAMAGGTNWRTVSATITNVYFKSAYLLGLADTSRWSTRIYDGLAAVVTGRSTASPLDTEVIEWAEQFTDIRTSVLTWSIPAARCIVTTKVNGVRSPAWHRGIYPSVASRTTQDCGAIFQGNASSGGITTSAQNVEFEGFINIQVGTGVHPFQLNSLGGTVKNCFIIGAPSSYGVNVNAPTCGAVHCFASGCLVGFRVTSYQDGAFLFNNTASGNVTGFGTDGTANALRGRFYNNAAIGNTTNWGTFSPAANALIAQAAYNAGESTNSPWNVGTATAITTLVSGDFADYANSDFKPASSTSHQVNAGVLHYGYAPDDLADNYVPDYESATYPNNIPDIGAFEFVHAAPDGGRPPATVPLSITSMVNGSEFAIYKTSDMSEIAAPQSTTGSYTANYTYTSDTAIIVRVRKKGYLPYEYAGTITATGFALSVSQIIDPIAI